MLLLVAAQMPEICPAMGPAPQSCAPDARESAAASASLLVLAVMVLGLGLTYVLPLSTRPLVLRLAMIAVALAGVVALVMTVMASGFILL